MLLLGHLGIGQAVARPWLKRLPLVPFFVGALLPDLLDKPVYYLTTAITGKHGAELGWLSGTRTIGHMMLVTLAIAAIGKWRHSNLLLAVALGMVTHQLLDIAADTVGNAFGVLAPYGVPGYAAVIWPLAGTQFPTAPFNGVSEHLDRLMNPVTLGSEVIGAMLLFWNWRRARVTSSSG